VLTPQSSGRSSDIVTGAWSGPSIASADRISSSCDRTIWAWPISSSDVSSSNG
jgi:hypothetical protein